MQRAWVVASVVALGGCASHPLPPPARTHVVQSASRSPTALDYLVYASMADTALPLSIATYQARDADHSEVAVQLQ